MPSGGQEAWAEQTTLTSPNPCWELGIQSQARDVTSDDIRDYCLENWEFELPYREGKDLNDLNLGCSCGKSRNYIYPIWSE